MSVFKKSEIPAKSVWGIVSGGYSDISVARSSAEMIKSRGGAGYVKSTEYIEIVYAVYKDKESADEVLKKLSMAGLYLVEIEIDASELKWCDKEYYNAVEGALTYYDKSFDALKTWADSLADGKLTIGDVKIKINVLYGQIEEIKSLFYNSVANYDCEQITQIKLALITTLALLDNIEYDNSDALCISSLRYQLVQLVLCHQALMRNI